MEGKQIGEETLDFYTFSKETANYVVHNEIYIWNYQQKKFTAFAPRRSDMKKGKKPWPQKGTGKARAGSKASPLFNKGACSNKGPYGLDNKRKLKSKRSTHSRAISTVLQSKWRRIKLVQGLEDAFQEPRQKKLEEFIKKVTGVKPGIKHTLIITRQGFGWESHHNPKYTWVNHPIYAAGRFIDRLVMRRPRDIDPEHDGLKQCLKARRIIISREAFFDLVAKYDKETGWCLKSEREIEVEEMQRLIKEIPWDRKAEMEAVKELPVDIDGREFWAKAKREEEAAQAAA